MLNKHLSYKHPHECKEVVNIRTAGAASKCSADNAIHIHIRPNSLKPLFGTPQWKVRKKAKSQGKVRDFFFCLDSSNPEFQLRCFWWLRWCCMAFNRLPFLWLL